MKGHGLWEGSLVFGVWGNKKASVVAEAEIGAKDGARSRDNQIHNLGLYQLSYFRQKTPNKIAN